MGSTETGDLYTQEQFDAMTRQERSDLGIVPITPKEEAVLAPMSKDERKKWFKANKSKKPSRKQLNKRERQRRRAGRSK